MARRSRLDQALVARLDAFEKAIFQLKIAYEKYFNGVDPVEPARDREAVRRVARELARVDYPSTALRYRYRALQARLNSLELYLNRNLLMVERGTHPKFAFRAELAERRRAEREARAEARREREARRDRAKDPFRAIYDRYLEARRRCGQSADLPYEDVRRAIERQVRAIQARTRCRAVALRVTVEGGKARVKAIPRR